MRFLSLALLVLSLASPAALEKVKVVTTLTDLAWATKKIGGEHVEVRSLLKGTENPHFVDTVPDFIRHVANADIVCGVGLQLEVGWLPKVLSRSGNAQVQPGGKGFCETGRAVEVLQKPTGPVDRSMGDVHPAGNPHFWLSPKSLGDGTREIVAALSRVDPEHAADYDKNHKALVKELAELQAANRAKLAPFKGKAAVMEYHREFSYFFAAYELETAGTIEEKPGVPPSAGRIAEVSLQAKRSGVKAALAGPYAPKSVLNRFSELSGVPVVIVPTSIQPDAELSDYPKLQNHLVDDIVKALNRK